MAVTLYMELIEPSTDGRIVAWRYRQVIHLLGFHFNEPARVGLESDQPGAADPAALSLQRGKWHAVQGS